MAARAEQLRTEIERTRSELGHHAAELRVELREARGKALRVAAVAIGVLVVVGTARFVWKRMRG